MQSGSEQSTSPSPSLSEPSTQSSAGHDVVPVQSASSQSTSPSPSSSTPLLHTSVGTQAVCVAQLASAQSTSPSPSSSTLLLQSSAVTAPHCTSRVKVPSSPAPAPSTAKYRTSLAPALNAIASGFTLVSATSLHAVGEQPPSSSGSCTSIRSAPPVEVSTIP